MKRILRLFWVLILVIVVFVISSQPVEAAGKQPQEYLPLTCDRAKGKYMPMTTLVLVPLTDSLVVHVGATAEEIAKLLFFDFAYVHGNNVAPLNAILHNGEIAYLSCSYPDYIANIVTAGDTGYFVLGVAGALPVKEVQEIIDKLNISRLLQGELVTTVDQKNTTIALANSKPCGTLCVGLKPSSEGISKRDYKITFSEPTYSKSVRQKELVSFSVKVKNGGEFPIYAEGDNSLFLASTVKGISSLYHSSWIAPSLIARISGLLLPGDETAIVVTMGAPLRPGKYSETLQIKMGNTRVGALIPVSFSVENDNYKLGRIVSKDGSSYANFRKTPDLRGTVLGKLDVGSYVIIKGVQDAWVNIETKDGRVGWVYRPFISERL